MKKIIQIFLYRLIPAFNRFFGKDKNFNKSLIFYCSDFSFSGGLTDRLKGIITAYQIALFTNRSFKIIFNKPFKLSKILCHKNINWEVGLDSDAKKFLSVAKHYNFIDKTNKDQVVHDIKNIINDKNNILALRINQDYLEIFDAMNIKELKSWNHCFNQLFDFSDFTQQALNKYLDKNNWDKVIGIHCRFLNLLEDNIESGETYSADLLTAEYQDTINV